MKLSVPAAVLLCVFACPSALAGKPAANAPFSFKQADQRVPADAGLRAKIGKIAEQQLGRPRASRLGITVDVNTGEVRVVAPDMLPGGSDGVVAPDMSQGPGGVLSPAERQRLATEILRVDGITGVRFVDGSGRVVGRFGPGSRPRDPLPLVPARPDGIVGEKGSTAIVGEKGSSAGVDSRFPNLGIESTQDRALAGSVRQRLGERLGAEPAALIRAEAREGSVYLEPGGAGAPRAAQADVALAGLPGVLEIVNRLDP